MICWKKNFRWLFKLIRRRVVSYSTYPMKQQKTHNPNFIIGTLKFLIMLRLGTVHSTLNCPIGCRSIKFYSVACGIGNAADAAYFLILPEPSEYIILVLAENNAAMVSLALNPVPSPYIWVWEFSQAPTPALVVVRLWD